jgi:protein SCO1/2
MAAATGARAATLARGLGLDVSGRARFVPLLALVGILTTVLGSCGAGDDTSTRVGTAEFAASSNVTGTAGQSAHDTHATHADEPLGAATDFSLYHLDAAWLDQHGEQRQLASLGGRVQVVAMVYTNCGYACPRIVADMKRIEAELSPEARDQVGFVMVTIDPERDTPEHLQAYAEAVRLDPERWTLLTAPDNTVLELAALLGVKYRRISETDFSHTNVITILDKQGEIAHRQVGLGAEPGSTLKVIEGLVRTGA